MLMWTQTFPCCAYTNDTVIIKLENVFFQYSELIFTATKEGGEIKFCMRVLMGGYRVMPKFLHTVLHRGQWHDAIFLWIYGIKLLQNILKLKFIKILEYTFSRNIYAFSGLLLLVLILKCVGLKVKNV